MFINLISLIRFDTTNTIITPTDDESLNDPAFGSYNYAAPGADRYRLDLNLTQNPLGTTSQYTLAIFENDEVTYRSNYPEYNVLADELARRTYDESGNYTVNDFQIFVEGYTSDNQEGIVKINIGPGKAYIFGYEFNSVGVKSLTASKAREYTTTNFLTEVPFVVGNDLYVTKNTSLTAFVYDKINWNGAPLFYLSTGTSGAYSAAGTVRIGKYDALEATQNVHVYDVRLVSGVSPTNVKRIFYPGFTGSDQHVFSLSDGYLNVRNSGVGALVHPFTNSVSSYAVRNVNEHSYVIQRSKVLDISAGSGTIYLTDFATGTEFNSSTNCQFVSENDVRFFSPTGAQLSGITVNKTSNTTLTYSGAPGVTNATVFTSINVDELLGDAYVRAKTSVTETGTFAITGNSFEKYAYFDGKVDVYSILSITGNTGSGAFDALLYFKLDNGHKDDIYDWSRLVLAREYFNSGLTSVQATYRRYTRENSCLPYMVRSYGTPASLGLNAGGTGAAYKFIPIHSFTNERGNDVWLTGCLDARPDRITPPSFSLTSSPENYGATGGCHLIEPSFNVKWTYYLPRTDTLVLGRDKTFRIVTGISDDRALQPPDSNDAMTLATLNYQPYTLSDKHIDLFYNKNRRYTMRDIGEIEKRVDKVEYYTTLNLLEQQASSLEIQDANGLNKFKNGIFADSFTSRFNSELTNVDNTFAVDRELSECRPRFITKYIDFSLTGATPAGLTFASNGLALCNYTTEIFIEQQLASRFVNVNPYDVVTFVGNMNLIPSTDDWIDVEVRPDAIINIDNVQSGINDGESIELGTAWNDWETTWTGRPITLQDPRNPLLSEREVSQRRARGDTSARANPLFPRGGHWIPEERVGSFTPTRLTELTNVRATVTSIAEQRQVRTGSRTFMTPTSSTQRLSNRVIERNAIPIMRAVDINFKVDNLRPLVQFYPFFDDTPVSDLIKINGVTSSAPLISDASGRLGYNQELTLSIPSGRFRTGTRVFRLIDVPNNILENSSSYSQNNFVSSGVLRVEEGMVVSTRNMSFRTTNVSEEQTTTGLVTQTFRAVRYIDPVAQTFLVDPTAYPSGLFLKKVEIYFKSKDSSLPITFEIRPVVNGYPSSIDSIPFSRVVLLPDQINISEDSSVSTEFVFENPVYLQSGEYAIVLITNSGNYNVFVSEVGQFDLISEQRITSQPYLGSFFKSQNSSTWTAEQMMDLKFKIHKCLFDTTGGTLQFNFDETDFSTESTGVINGANLFKFNATTITPSETSFDYSVTFETDNIEIPCNNGENIIFTQKKSIADASVDTIIGKITFNTTNDDVSPILDLQRVSGLYVQNLITTFVNDAQQTTYEKLPSLAGVSADARSCFRYMSKVISLQDGFESNDVDVYFAARLPLNSEIKVYMRSQSNFDNTNFNSTPFEPLVVHPDYTNILNNTSQYVSYSDLDYIDLRFIRGATGATGSVITSGITGQTEFKRFQIKVVGYGDNTNSLVPSFKEFRAIAT